MLEPTKNLPDLLSIASPESLQLAAGFNKASSATSEYKHFRQAACDFKMKLLVNHKSHNNN